MSLAETSFDYEHTVWDCTLLPFRIVLCIDHIQYIVQLREQTKCRNLSFHMDWGSIGRRYLQLAMAGLPEHSPEMLEDEVRRWVMRLNKKPAHSEVGVVRLPVLDRHPEPSAEQV